MENLMMENIIGDLWMPTFSGITFWPLDPKASEVNIVDIAHALSMTCRYAGHTKKFYSVAEHSVWVSKFVPPKHALWGLMHDAAEAYADIPSPIKKYLTGWKDIEKRIMDTICIKYNMEFEEPPDVKRIDLAILSDERNLVMNPSDKEWGITKEILGADLQCLNPTEAKVLFLNRFKEITGRIF